MSIDIIDKLHDDYIVSYLQALDCPRSLTCYLLWVHNEHKQLVELSFEPSFYNGVREAADSLAATKFLSKATFLKTGINLKEVAMSSFYEAEAICKETNARIRGGRFENPSTCAILLGMAYKISNILTNFSADEFVDNANWGPGSTTLLRKSKATHPNKFSVERKITAEAYDFVKPWFHLAYPSWEMRFDIDGFSKIVTVPKNAKTDRVIAIEPGINLWFQKSIGSMLRTRLKAHGIDLNDQTVNQKRARLASVSNTLATVDFSMASDTIAYALVEEILPLNWFSLLRTFRTASTKVSGKTLHFSKFSSMGNGFTFELESLIFFAMATACCDHVGVSCKGISVFGDDVVLPTSVYDLFASVSKDLGFKVNLTKSYDLGPYRESCGSHYWLGGSIKPIFHKEPFDGQQSVIKAANLLRTSNRINHLYGCDRRLRTTWRSLVQYLGQKCPRVPYGYGDIGVVENFDDSIAYRRSAGNGYEGYFVRIHAVQAVNQEVFSTGLYLTKIKAIGSERLLGWDRVNLLTSGELPANCGGNHIPLPGRIRYAMKRKLIPQWVDVGDWV